MSDNKNPQMVNLVRACAVLGRRSHKLLDEVLNIVTKEDIPPDAEIPTRMLKEFEAIVKEATEMLFSKVESRAAYNELVADTIMDLLKKR